MKKTFALAASLLLAACTHEPQANKEELGRTLASYLQQNGDFCLGLYGWPVVVPDQPDVHDYRALQMPVLEKAGIVGGSRIQLEDHDAAGKKVTAWAHRYDLTDEGRKYFIMHTVPGRQPRQDLCAARLGLDKVVGFTTRTDAAGALHAGVMYTYTVQTTPWAQRADVQRVFPLVGRVVNGGGRVELRQNFKRVDEQWVPQGVE